MIVSQSVRSKLATKLKRMNRQLKPSRSIRITARTLALLVFSITMLGACQKKQADDESLGTPAESEKVTALRNDVIAVHDEVMPLMSTIYTLKNSLKENLNTRPELSAVHKKQIEETIASLDSADRGMRVWMREFSKLETSGMPEDEAIAALESEMKKITKVKDDMLSSVDKAAELYAAIK